MHIRTFYLFIFLLLAANVNAQTGSNEYLPEDFDAIKNYLKAINLKHVQKIDGKFSSKIKKVYKDRDEKIVKSIEDSAYFFNSSIQKSLDGVLQEIYDSNPEINSEDYCFFINNSLVPNAACYGDGMFEINLGLFTRLESDDELAFIICHEIAHKRLEHSLKNVSRRVALVNSKDTKKKINDVKSRKYGKTRAALSVIDELNIDILDYSREAEAEADSLGFVFFSKTKYLKPCALWSLEKLKKVNEMVFHYDVKLDSVFNFEDYPFQSYWLKETTSLFDTTEKINEFAIVSDTLKTHPEIEFRIDKLIGDFNIEKGKGDLGLVKEHLPKMKKVSHIQSIQFTYDLKMLDLTLYQLIEKFNNKKIEPEYYFLKMAETLQQVYLTKKNHELGKYVPQKSSLSDEKQLNVIRLFLHNLELKEVKKIALAFCDLHHPKVTNKESFHTIHNFFKTLNN
ncbi:M48 family metalloprotease [Snuella sedimenti]|uniref:M48 family metalloprotease n=1 Tax=Snuella sedimenti TaxID=2798802 RepID=A0A8J7LXD8_9FLAO|nr:M48 family metalloprotease [Snuella sedimenti]MBJ6366581.1 M48 family metalloprotease [Snuella sedimenti]